MLKQKEISFAEKRLVYINTRDLLSKAQEVDKPAEVETPRGRAKSEIERQTKLEEKRLQKEVESKKNDEPKKEEKQAEAQDAKAAEKKVEAISNPTETLTALGYTKPKTEYVGISKIVKLPEGKQIEKDYLDGAEKIWNSQKEKKKEFSEKIKQMETQFGLPVDEAAFEKKTIEFMASYAQQALDKEQFSDVVEYVAGNREWWHLIDFNRSLAMRSAMNKVQAQIDGESQALQDSLKKLPKETLESRKADLPRLLAKINPEFVKGGKLQPTILDYLLAGNDLMRDITLIGIADKWETMKPGFAQIENLLGKKIDEKASLASLSKLSTDPKALLDFEAKTKAFMQVFAQLEGFQLAGEEADKNKIAEIIKAEIGGGEKINLVELAQNPPEKIKKLTEKIQEVTKKVEAITKIINSSLEKFGGKLPSLTTLTSLLGEGGFNPDLLKKILDNPNSLEGEILTILKAKFQNIPEIQALNNLDGLDKTLKEYFETTEKQLDEAILAIFTSGFEIKAKKPGEKPIKINFEKEKIEALLPKIRKQLLPILSESIAKQTKTPLLNASGEIDLGNIEKIISNEDKKIPGDENIKLVLKFFSETKGDKTKMEEFINKPENKAAKEAVSAFCGNVFDTILNSQNPEIAEVRDEVAKIAPPELVEAMSKGMLEDTFKELQEAFKAGSIGGIFEALMNVLGKIMGKVGMLMNWVKDKISPTVNQAAGALRKAGANDIAASLESFIKPENAASKAETPQQQISKKLNSEFGFDAKDIETIQTQDFKMEELMGEKVDFAALKTKYKFAEGVKLEDLAKQIKETNKYNPTENKATKVWDFLIKIQTPPQETKNEAKK